MYQYKYPHPAVTTDIVVINKKNKVQELLLIKRKNAPFANHWALPGGFVDENEALYTAAKRELKEETGIEGINLIQFKAYGDPGRDPRGHCVSIVYIANLQNQNIYIQAGDDAKEAKWFNIKNLPPLAFDHEIIIGEVIKQIL